MEKNKSNWKAEIKHKENVSTPIFKRGKVSQFHLNYISGILDKILSGQINTKEALELLKKASIESGETVIKDVGAIKRCVEMILKDRPDELKLYYEMLKKNPGKRNPNKGQIGKSQIGLYYEKEAEFKKQIIEHYLPLIISGQIKFDMIEQELHSSHHTVNKVIEEFYIQNNDLKGLEEYRKAKKRNKGSIETRENARRKREKIAKYNVVTNKEFIHLSPEQQELQLIMKIETEKLREEVSETSARKTALIKEDIIKNKIKIIMNYFKSKNVSNSDEVYFSNEDIRYMIFRYPTLISRTEETLEEKLNILNLYIDEKTAYQMIKTFPAIMGYDALRIKGQLDLLERENLIDAVISAPRRFMNSINLIYALIQYAKERYNTSDLRDINRNNIFLPNNLLKRVYGVSYDEIKTKYPYSAQKEQDIIYTISPKEIAQSTYSARKKSEEANNVLNQAIKDNKKGEKIQ